MSAQSMSLRDRAQISRTARHEAAARLAGSSQSQKIKKAAPAQASQYVSAIVRIDPEASDASFGEGIEVKHCRGGFSIIMMPASEVQRISSHPSIKSFSLGRPVDMKLDKARLVSGVDKIHTGEGLPSKYTGKGVVAGVVDNGIDPNHVNFLFPNGSSRISMLSVAGVDRYGQPTTKIYTHDNVGSFTTDDPYNYHGTHTLGILSGSYDGDAKVAYQSADGTFNIDENCSRNPYYGVAPSADLAVGAGSDYDAYIVYNIENILDYAAQTGQRAVINLSLGSSLGPHDGSTPLNQYLDLISMSGDFIIDGQPYHGDNAIICISAGNEGDMPIAWNKTISAADPEAKTFFISLIDDEEAAVAGLKNMRMGQLYVYGNDSRPFKIQLVAWNNQRNRAAWSKTLVEASETVQYYCSSSTYQQDDTDVVDQAFANYFEGYVGMGTGIDTDNGRYFAVLDIAAIDNVEGSNADGRYSLGFIVTYIADDGAPQRIETYGDADGIQGFGSLGKDGWIQPTGNGTISDMACGKNQIIVGAYNTRESWLSLDSNIYSYGENRIPANEVTEFSSWGTLADGRNLPHVLAPGAVIISSSNQYYHTNTSNAGNGYNPMAPGVRQAETSFGGRDHYWVQMSGTSMASPFVAGAMALWLEADPELTVEEMRDIIARTSVKDEYTAKVADQVKVGAGKFDAYAGLKEVLRRSSIVDIATEAKSDDVLVRNLGANVFEVSLPGAKSLNIAVFDMLGREVARCNSDSDEATITLPSSLSGVCVLNVNGTASKKIIIK